MSCDFWFVSRRSRKCSSFEELFSVLIWNDNDAYSVYFFFVFILSSTFSSQANCTTKQCHFCSSILEVHYNVLKCNFLKLVHVQFNFANFLLKTIESICIFDKLNSFLFAPCFLAIVWSMFFRLLYFLQALAHTFHLRDKLLKVIWTCCHRQFILIWHIQSEVNKLDC